MQGRVPLGLEFPYLKGRETLPSRAKFCLLKPCESDSPGDRVKYCILGLHLLYIRAKIRHGSIQGRTIFPSISATKQLQPETDDEDSIIQVEDEDGNAIQSSEPTQSNEIPSSSSSSSKKRKQGPTTKTSTSKKPKKFSWTADKAKDLLKYVREYKSACEFRGVDFETDLACMYTEARRCMAWNYY